jgi:hypothetical protein
MYLSYLQLFVNLDAVGRLSHQVKYILSQFSNLILVNKRTLLVLFVLFITAKDIDL